jgi:hypothetical protein
MLMHSAGRSRAPISNLGRQPGWLRQYTKPDACPLWVAEGKLMPRVSDDFVDCVIYLYPDEPAADAGERAGGSGFLVGINVSRQIGNERVRLNAAHLYAVSNDHVVKGGSCTIRLNDQYGSKIVYQTKETEWVSHPDGDDIAVCGVDLSPQICKLRYVEIEYFLSNEIVQTYSIGPGDNILWLADF